MVTLLRLNNKHGVIVPGVMVDQKEALSDTTLGLPYQHSNHQPLDQQSATLHFATRVSITWNRRFNLSFPRFNSFWKPRIIFPHLLRHFL